MELTRTRAPLPEGHFARGHAHEPGKLVLAFLVSLLLGALLWAAIIAVVIEVF